MHVRSSNDKRHTTSNEYLVSPFPPPSPPPFSPHLPAPPRACCVWSKALYLGDFAGGRGGGRLPRLENTPTYHITLVLARLLAKERPRIVPISPYCPSNDICPAAEAARVLRYGKRVSPQVLGSTTVFCAHARICMIVLLFQATCFILFSCFL